MEQSVPGVAEGTMDTQTARGKRRKKRKNRRKERRKRRTKEEGRRRGKKKKKEKIIIVIVIIRQAFISARCRTQKSHRCDGLTTYVLK